MEETDSNRDKRDKRKRDEELDDWDEWIIECVYEYGGSTCYRDIQRTLSKKIPNASGNIPNRIIKLCRIGIFKESHHITYDRKKDPSYKGIRRDNVRCTLNLETNSKVYEILGKIKCRNFINKIPNKGMYDFIALAEILAPRLGSIGAMWQKSIIAERTGYKIAMCIRETNKNNSPIIFKYEDNGEFKSAPTLEDQVKTIYNVELSNGKKINEIVKGYEIHFYSEIPYNSGFFVASAIAALAVVGSKFMDRDTRKDFIDKVKGCPHIPLNEEIKDSEKIEMVRDAIKIMNNIKYAKLKLSEGDKPIVPEVIPSITSTCAEYLLLCGAKPEHGKEIDPSATVFYYKNTGKINLSDEESNEDEIKIRPKCKSYRIYDYYEDYLEGRTMHLFTDIWTGPGHNFPNILRSIYIRVKRFSNDPTFFEDVAEQLDKSIERFGKVGLDLIEKGLLESIENRENEDKAQVDITEKIQEGFQLLKQAIYEQICHSLRFTFNYISYPHIANLCHLMRQVGLYGSPVGAGGGGFFQILNDMFKYNHEAIKLAVRFCQDWCLNHGGKEIRKIPGILPSRKRDTLLSIYISPAEYYKGA